MSEYISDKFLIPRKAHRCCICDQRIDKGEKCHAYTGSEDGRIYTNHAHIMCYSYTRSWDWYDWDGFSGGMCRREIAMDIIHESTGGAG